MFYKICRNLGVVFCTCSTEQGEATQKYGDKNYIAVSAPRFCKCHYPKTTHCMVWIGNLLWERKSQQPQKTHFWVLCEIWQALQGLSWCLALHSFPELLVSSHVPPQNFPQTPWSSFSMLKASIATYMCPHWYAIYAAWLKIKKIWIIKLRVF